MKSPRSALVLGAVILLVAISVSSRAAAWSNGGYSADPSNPDYGTHDWIAQHALDWLPAAEKNYITDNLATYLYGTELPDNGGAPDGIGDQTLHHVYYYSGGSLQDGASAVRASGEYQSAKAYLTASDFATAAKTAGILSHYVVDVAVFGHVMGAYTDWGAEVHHSDYEDYVTAQMTGYTSWMFDPYLSFDGALENVTAYDSTLQVAYDTTFGDGAGTQTCAWMDANYDWSNSVFKASAGASLNRAVNALADVLHTLAVEGGLSPPSPDTVPPTVTITSPGNGATLTSATITVVGTASDNVAVQKVQVSRDATTWVTGTGTTSWSASLTLVEGPNTIYARATDTSGNVANATVSVTGQFPGPSPDTIAPTVAILSPTPGATLASTTITVTGTASDNVALDTVQVSKDGANWVDAAGTSSWSAVLSLREGSNTILARAVDTSGNTAVASVSVTVTTSSPGTSPSGVDPVAVGVVATILAVAATVGVAVVVVRRRKLVR